MNKLDKEKLINWLKEKREVIKEQAPEHFKTNNEVQLFLAGADTCFFGIIEQIEAGRFDIEE